MKRVLPLLVSIVVGTLVVVGLGSVYLLWSGAPTVHSPASASLVVASPPPKLRALPDVDALARRMLNNQDIYAKLRDQAIAAYAKAHPGTHSYDAEARETLKLASYLLVWDDFYGERLWRTLDGHADHLESQGCPDPLWLSLRDQVWGPHENSSYEGGVELVNRHANAVGASGYPVAFKLAAYDMAMNNMISAKHDNNIKPPLVSSIAALPEVTAKVAACYGDLAARHPPTPYLYSEGRKLLNDAKDDESSLELVSKGIDRAWATNDRNSAEADVLDAVFYIDKAWGARGGGYADTVSDQGWKTFRDNMGYASDLLTRVYARTPQQPGVARGMMNVAQGLPLPRDQMELWFRRAIQVDPNDDTAYESKEYFLLPRWYGTEEEEWAFGMECAKGANWAAKIPLIIVDELAYRAEAEPEVYEQDEVWEPLDGIYREFLVRYPDSVHYRSLFALNAAQGGHWNVAKEQFKILGDDWDPDVFPDTLYADTLRKVNAH